MSQPIDEELRVLLPDAMAGDRKAIQELIRLIYPAVIRYTRVRIGGGRTPTAEDVSQEVCLAVANSIGRYVDRGRPFMAYVYGIASNKVADAHRLMSRDQSFPTEELPEGESTDANPEEVALNIDGRNRTQLLLDGLSDKARDIVILRVIEGLSAEETAAIVGSTPGAVRVAQHRALAVLRKKVEQGE
ncbi:sigma-70 family RNA polymerase sigma factor [Corynebacterium caspium]|uniref:sigma-70 family RNA polymerase sigma factor n=1 Tax=Corynebacterium caspium TaxID=234828 RepID=UPI000376AA7F|nr:sigma-70 family RNA polymerase sigma factor [Corynebacterium caspium]WKD59789.1 ECF RNA polymerase sigma factor SigD [Corynebacterium caspium DSM 44850]